MDTSIIRQDGMFGATAACAKLLDLSAGEIEQCLCLASSFAGGPKQQFGGDGKALHQAAQRNSVSANAALTKTSALVAEGVVRKAYPSCHYTHRLIDAATELAAEFASAQIPIAAIAGIALYIPDVYADVVAKTNPRQAAEARFSVGYCVAMALLDGAINTASFAPRQIARQDVHKLMALIAVRPYPVANLSGLSPDAADTIIVRLADGKRYERVVYAVRGSKQLLLDDAAIAQ